MTSISKYGSFLTCQPSQLLWSTETLCRVKALLKMMTDSSGFSLAAWYPHIMMGSSFSSGTHIILSTASISLLQTCEDSGLLRDLGNAGEEPPHLRRGNHPSLKLLVCMNPAMNIS